MPTPGYAGNTNTYINTLELSGNLMIGFSRNIDQFPLNKYVTYTPTKLPFGEFLYFNPLDLARTRNVPHGDRWSPGTLRPVGFNNTIGFYSQNFRCERRSFNTALDTVAVDVANWPIQKTHSEALAQEAMTNRAYQVNAVLFDAAQYAANAGLDVNRDDQFVSIRVTQNGASDETNIYAVAVDVRPYPPGSDGA